MICNFFCLLFKSLLLFPFKIKIYLTFVDSPHIKVNLHNFNLFNMKSRPHFIFPIYDRNALNVDFYCRGLKFLSVQKFCWVSAFGINKCKTFSLSFLRHSPVVWYSTPHSQVLKVMDPLHLWNVEETLFSVLLFFAVWWQEVRLINHHWYTSAVIRFPVPGKVLPRAEVLAQCGCSAYTDQEAAWGIRVLVSAAGLQSSIHKGC